MNPAMPAIDLNPNHWAEVARILREHVPQFEVWAFGSRVKWTAKSHSDLDLAVITQAPLPIEVLAALKDAFSESDLPIRIDVVDWAATTESFRKIIEREKVVVQKAWRNDDDRMQWPVLTLEECLDALIDYRGKTPEKTNSGIPLVTAKVIKSGRIETPSEFIAESDYESWMRRGIPNAGDVVLTTEAPLGEVAQLGSEKIALAQRVIALRGKRNLLDNTYLLYLLQTDEMQDQLKARATGTTVLGIKQSELRKLSLRIPPLETQHGVAAVLKALDDRIALLRETNATLEAIAQALFKSWFVDFDPVRAKQAGRAPEGMDEATAALFPDGFEESALGLLPRGWRLLPFGQLLSHTIGGDWGTEIPDEKNDTKVAIIRGTDIPDLQAGGSIRVPVRYTSNKKLLTRKLQHGDIVLEVSGGSKEQPTGRALYLTDGMLGQFDCPVEPASFCRLLRPRTENIGVLLGQHLNYIYAQGRTWEYQNQSTGIANFQTTHFLETELVALPPEDVLAEFANIVRPMIARGHLTQIQRLAEIRDTLLPRLISGQLRLPAAEAALAAAL